jgi:hypothetical protein
MLKCLTQYVIYMLYKDCWIVIIQLLYFLGIVLFIEGVVLDNSFGKNFIETNIRITFVNNTLYKFIFINNFLCKTCLGTTNVCNSNTCSTLMVNHNYTYYCDCNNKVCGFTKYNYFTSDPFILIISGLTIIITVIIFSVCNYVKYRLNNNVVNPDM